MAQSRKRSREQYPEPKSFTSSKKRPGLYVHGKHLSFKETFDILSGSRSSSGEKILETLENLRDHNFQVMRQSFPVSNLQHVTKESCMRSIIRMSAFKPSSEVAKPEFKDLIYWSADIDSGDIETAWRNLSQSKRRYLMLGIEQSAKEQFANSPAFNKSASRYGNFKFSLPFPYLLSEYKAQHCGGREPTLRILGTDLYKQEVAHYILVHSPDANQFSDLPIIPSDETSSGPLPFVYWKEGQLYWRPESTSNVLTEKISEKGHVPRECYRNCEYFLENNSCFHTEDEDYKIWSVWNHLVFAFHLPNNGFLKVPEELLRKNLSTCEIDEPALIFPNECLGLRAANKIVMDIKKS